MFLAGSRFGAYDIASLLDAGGLGEVSRATTGARAFQASGTMRLRIRQL